MTRRLTILIVALATTWGTMAVTGAQSAGDPERDLRAAIEAETIHGDIAAAVAQYRILVASDDRSVAVRALLRLARREAIQGDATARTTYERVLEFADQPEAVAEASARLAALDEEQTGAQHRLVWDDAIDLWGSVSADGRWLSFVDWETGDLGLRDLTTGQNRRLTDYGGFAHGEVEGNAIAPDGRRIAFAYDRWDDRAADEAYVELRVIDADGSNARTLLANQDYAYLEPHAWSPDGTSIAVQMRRPSGEFSNGRGARPGGDVVVVSIDGETVRTVASYPDVEPWRIRYSPDGRWLSYDLHVNTRLRPGSGAVRGMAVVRADGSTAPTLLAEGANNMGWTADGGHVLFTRERFGATELYAQSFVDGRLTGSPSKVNAAGGVGDPMGMTTDGRLFYGTTRVAEDALLGNFDSETGALSALTTLRPIQARRGARGSCAPQFSSDGRRLALVTGRNSVVIRDLDSNDEQVVLPALQEIHALRWEPDGGAILVAGSDGESGIFRVDLATHTTTLEFRTVTPVFGVSPDGETIYYRDQALGGVASRDRRTDVPAHIADWTGGVLDIVPSPDGLTLALTGANRLVFVDLATGEARIRWQGVDGENPRVREGAWTSDSRTFVTQFAEGGDTRELWSVPVGDGEIRRAPLEGLMMGVSLSPDGRHVAMMRVETVSQLWVIEHFLPAGQR